MSLSNIFFKKDINLTKNSAIGRSFCNIIKKELSSVEDSSSIQIQAKKFSVRINLNETERKSLQLVQTYVPVNDKFKSFTLVDAPVSIYGTNHLGIFLNRVLKDFVIRSKQLLCYNVNYTLGLSCYDKDLELEVLLEQRKKQIVPLDLTNDATEKIIKEFAHKKIVKYIQDLVRWGVNLQNTHLYTTYDYRYHEAVYEIFEKLLNKRLLHESFKIKLWSIRQQREILESEIDVKEIEVDSFFIKFNCISSKNAIKYGIPEGKLKFLLPFDKFHAIFGVQAVAINPKINYSIIRMDKEYIVVSTAYWRKNSESFKKIERESKMIMNVLGDMFEDSLIEVPITEEKVPVILNEEVTLNDYFGIKPIMPALSISDYAFFQKVGGSVPIKNIINPFGQLDYEVPKDFKNLSQTEAHQQLMVSLQKHLIKCAQPLKQQQIIFTETQENVELILHPGIFCLIDSVDSEVYMEELEKVHGSGDSYFENVSEKLSSIIDQRSGSTWCITNNLNFGICVPVFQRKKDNKIVFNHDIICHVLNIMREKGHNAWKDWTIEELLPNSYKKGAGELIKSTFSFDSRFIKACYWLPTLITRSLEEKSQDLSLIGSSFIFENPTDEENMKKNNENKVYQNKKKPLYPGDLVLESFEGVHDWLPDSAILEAIFRGRPSFTKMKWHPMVLNSMSKEKMTKKANFGFDLQTLIDGPNDMNIDGDGADPLRLWVASIDLQKHTSAYLKINDEDVKSKKSEIVMIRKIIWQAFGFINDFKLKDYNTNVYLFPFSESLLLLLNFFMLNLKNSLENLNFNQSYKLIIDFMTSYFLNGLLNSTKHYLMYNKSQDDDLTNEIKYVFCKYVEYTILSISPILVFNAQSMYNSVQFKDKEKNVFHEKFPEIINHQNLKNKRQNLENLKILWSIKNKAREEQIVVQNRTKISDPLKMSLILVEKEIPDKESHHIFKLMEPFTEEFFQVFSFQIMTQEEWTNLNLAHPTGAFNISYEYKKKTYKWKGIFFAEKLKKCSKCKLYFKNEIKDHDIPRDSLEPTSETSDSTEQSCYDKCKLFKLRDSFKL